MSELKQKRINKSETLLQIYLKSILFGNIAFLMLLSISAFILTKIYIETKFLFIFILCASAISVLIASLFIVLKTHKNKLINSIIINSILTLIHLIIIIVFNYPNVSLLMYLIIPLNIILSFIGSIAGINKRK